MTGKPVASLKTRMVRSTARVLVTYVVVLFGSAGTAFYWQAWLYLVLQAGSMIPINIYLLRNDPELLRRRLALEEQGETQPLQKVLLALVPVLGVALLLLAGLDRRYGWSHVPLATVVVASLTFAAGVVLFFQVLRENSYASSVIEIDPEQSVVRTGPYRLVRHPMYTAFLLMGAATPLTLGSYVAELALLPACAVLVLRALAEERFLAEQLPGYASYMETTRKRLIPYVW